jgi:asparagine synthetase B (glutamine-hydrolysing)
MCGIFGVVRELGESLSRADQRLLERLFLRSASRGKEAAGIALLPAVAAVPAEVLKADVAPKELLRHRDYARLLKRVPAAAAIGHSRLVTNGSQTNARNNQPVVSGPIVGVHNGIVVNVAELAAAYLTLAPGAELDSEILFALVAEHRRSLGLREAIARAFSQIKGSASIALFDAESRQVALATNIGSLYTWRRGETLAFASESSILHALGADAVERVDPGAVRVIDIAGGRGAELPANVVTVQGKRRGSIPELLLRTVPQRFEAAAQKSEDAARALRRCARCVLPETTPYLSFDAAGVCQICRAHVPLVMKGKDALLRALAARKDHGRFDCLLAFSGGRDSSYGLHYAVKELGLKPVTYTYDWGLVTDLARRNVARMCAALSVENIVVSADIAKKRENVRLNVAAWLKKPHLGMVPLFMAGDKQFFWYAHVIKRQLGMRFDIFTMNLLENAMFKDDFTGSQVWDDGRDSNRIGNTLGLSKSARLAAFYGRQFALNPGYWNRSLPDTFLAYLSYYFLPRNYLVMYEYVPWEERTIDRTLVGEYGWETSPDTASTWRIGDGTTPFYNLIYHTAAGLTENDTLRSNQVREGQLTRAEALELVHRDNRPRWPSLQWYCATIGLPFERTIDTVLGLPKDPRLLRDPIVIARAS